MLWVPHLSTNRGEGQLDSAGQSLESGLVASEPLLGGRYRNTRVVWNFLQDVWTVVLALTT